MTHATDDISPHLSDYYRQQREQKERRDAEARRKDEIDRHNRARLETMKVKMLDAIDAQLDAIVARQKADAAGGAFGDGLAQTDKRRQIAHIVGAPKFCSRKACRRTHSCCGEPKHCLAIALPLLPPQVVVKLALGPRRTRRGGAS